MLQSGLSGTDPKKVLRLYREHGLAFRKCNKGKNCPVERTSLVAAVGGRLNCFGRVLRPFPMRELYATQRGISFQLRARSFRLIAPRLQRALNMVVGLAL